MPEISRFYGIIIAMFFDDYNPPHSICPECMQKLYGDIIDDK